MSRAAHDAKASAAALSDDQDAGDFLVPFGRKYRGKRVREIPRPEIESYVAWLESDDAEKKGTPLSQVAQELKIAVQEFWAEADAAAAAGEQAS